MSNRLRRFTVLPIAMMVASVGLAAQDNLRLCLDGRYPTLCDHSVLTVEQKAAVAKAEHSANVDMCMDGRYASLCDHSRLTTSEAESVKRAERAANLKMCSDGRYPSLCRHELLSSAEAEQVRRAEAAANLQICLDGRYASLCNHAILTDSEKQAAASAEAVASTSKKTAPKSPVRTPRAPAPTPRCEDGHSLESIEGDGKILKLDDGSMWEVDDADTVTSSAWVSASEVILCGSKIINTDDDDSVEVTPLDSPSSSRSNRPGKTAYAVQVAANDETFVINDEVFKAKTYCFNIEKGDRVIFVSGSAFGGCASAKILNLRTSKVCDVWCE